MLPNLYDDCDPQDGAYATPHYANDDNKSSFGTENEDAFLPGQNDEEYGRENL